MREGTEKKGGWSTHSSQAAVKNHRMVRAILGMTVQLNVFDSSDRIDAKVLSPRMMIAQARRMSTARLGVSKTL